MNRRKLRAISYEFANKANLCALPSVLALRFLCLFGLADLFCIFAGILFVVVRKRDNKLVYQQMFAGSSQEARFKRQDFTWTRVVATPNPKYCI